MYGILIYLVYGCLVFGSELHYCFVWPQDYLVWSEYLKNVLQIFESLGKACFQILNLRFDFSEARLDFSEAGLQMYDLSLDFSEATLQMNDLSLDFSEAALEMYDLIG